MAKKEWLVVVWNDGSGQFSIERRMLLLIHTILNMRHVHLMKLEM